MGLKGHDSSKVETMEPIYEHPIVVRFKASTTSGLPWKFTPCQESIIGNVIDQSSKTSHLHFRWLEDSFSELEKSA